MSLDIVNAIHECGWSAYLSILLGALGSLGALSGLALLGSSQRKSAWALGGAALLFGILSLGAGLAGASMGRSATDSALVAVEASMRDRLREVGYAEAMQCNAIAGRTSALPIVVGLLVLGIGLAVRKSRSA